MTKAEMIKLLEDYPDDAQILIWRWTENGSQWRIANPTCGRKTNAVVITGADFILSEKEADKIMGLTEQAE